MQNFLNLKLSIACDSLVSQRKFNELLKNLNLIDKLIEQRNKFAMNKTSQRKKIDFIFLNLKNLLKKSFQFEFEKLIARQILGRVQQIGPMRMISF